jgi:hypothetical protein
MEGRMQNAECRMQKGWAKPSQATTKPYTRHILRGTEAPQGHPKATPKPLQSQLLGNQLGTQSHPKATLKPPQSQLLGNQLGTQSHPKATLKPPQSHPKATPKLPQSYPKATPKLHLTWIFQTPIGMPAVRRVGARGLPERCALVGRVPPRGVQSCEIFRLSHLVRAFQSLGGAEPTCFPGVLATTRLSSFNASLLFNPNSD